VERRHGDPGRRGDPVTDRGAARDWQPVEGDVRVVRPAAGRHGGLLRSSGRIDSLDEGIAVN
jgi:hypothetical protein